MIKGYTWIMSAVAVLALVGCGGQPTVNGEPTASPENVVQAAVNAYYEGDCATAVSLSIAVMNTTGEKRANNEKYLIGICRAGHDAGEYEVLAGMKCEPGRQIGRTAVEVVCATNDGKRRLVSGAQQQGVGGSTDPNVWVSQLGHYDIVDGTEILKE